MIKKFLILTFIVSAFFSVSAQINGIHRKLLKTALQNNHTIKQSAFELERQEKKVVEVRSSALPSINGEMNTNKYIDMPTVVIPGALFGMPQDIEGSLGKPYNLDAGVSASQLLFSMPFIYGLKTAKNSVELYKQLKIKSEEDVIYQVSHLYYTYLATIKSLEILEQNLEMINGNKKITQSLVENNMALPSDVKRLEVTEAEISNQINTVKTALQEQELRIALLVGAESYTIPESNDSLQINANDSLTDYSYTSRTELGLLEKQLQLEELNVKSAKAAYYPSLALFGSYMFNAQRDEFNYFSSDEKWNKISLIGLKLSVPIFSGLQRSSKVKQAKINHDITQNQLAQAQINYKHEQIIAHKQYETHQKNSATLYENTLRTKDLYKVTLLKYQEGLLPLTELLIANSDLSSSKLNYTKSLLDLYVAELNIYKATGQLKRLVNN